MMFVEQYNDVLLLFFAKTYPVLKNAIFLTAIFFVFQLETLSAYVLPQAMHI